MKKELLFMWLAWERWWQHSNSGGGRSKIGVKYAAYFTQGVERVETAQLTQNVERSAAKAKFNFAQSSKLAPPTFTCTPTLELMQFELRDFLKVLVETGDPTALRLGFCREVSINVVDIVLLKNLYPNDQTITVHNIETRCL